MMKKIITSILFMIFLSGCTTVVSKHPIGNEPYFANKNEWQGTWLSDKQIIKIKVLDEAAGSIQIAWIEDQSSGFKFETMTCQLLKSEHGIYINALNVPGEDFGGYYVWGKLNIENDRIIIWEPMFEAFKSAYDDKKIEALVKRNEKQEISDIQLIDTPKNILSLIENNKKFFDWEKPIVLMKLLAEKNQ